MKRRASILVCSPIGSLIAAFLCSAFATADDWPQWRGLKRDNISLETGLLQQWLDEGPPRLWTASGIGDGIASLAVADGKIFTLGYQHDSEFAIALDKATGELCWAVRLGPMVPDNPIMRWLSQRVPAVDGDRVYAFTAGGELICLNSADGSELWRKSYLADFGAKRPGFGYYEQPLVDGDLLICTPGGSRGQLALLDKRSGELRMMAGGPSEVGYRKDYVATVVAEIAGIRQYVTFLDQQLTGIAADDGRLLWRYEHLYRTTANSQTPIVRGEEIFCSAPYGQPASLLKLARHGNEMTVEQVYQQLCQLDYFQDSTVAVGEYVFASGGNLLKCLAWRSGDIAWQQRMPDAGRLCFTFADGQLYVRGSEGKMWLVEATPKQLVINGSFTIPDHLKANGATTPVVSGGKLYLRENAQLHCYDVHANRPPTDAGPRNVSVTVPPPSPQVTQHAGRRPPDGIFVPTPHDVVTRMLALAQPTKSEIICDLGCGDGRIVIAAARQFGCRAIGYDIDAELIAAARQQATKEGVSRIVSIERADVLSTGLGEIDVVTLYLLPEQLEALIPKLQKMKPGSRVVSHQFALKGIRAKQIETLHSGESGESHTIYLYKLPLTAAD